MPHYFSCVLFISIDMMHQPVSILKVWMLSLYDYYPIHINTSERNRGMDIHQLKQRIDASGKKLVTLGNEYVKSKDEIAVRKVLVKMFAEISQQTLLLGEQNA